MNPKPERDDTTTPDHVAAADLFRTLRHELRTPINHIVGYAELLLDEAEDGDYAALVPDLHRIEPTAHRDQPVLRGHEGRQCGAQRHRVRVSRPRHYRSAFWR